MDSKSKRSGASVTPITTGHRAKGKRGAPTKTAPTLPAEPVGPLDELDGRNLPAALVPFVPRALEALEVVSKLERELWAVAYPEAGEGPAGREVRHWCEAIIEIGADLARLLAGPAARAADERRALESLRGSAPNTYRALTTMALRLASSDGDLLFTNVGGQTDVYDHGAVTRDITNERGEVPVFQPTSAMAAVQQRARARVDEIARAQPAPEQRASRKAVAS